MIESSPSRTALAASLMRAVHSRRDPAPLLDDPWGDRLVPKSERDRFCQAVLGRMDPEARAAALQTPGSILDDFLLANVAYPGVIVRSRYAEDALREAVSRGIRQYVLLGAGFDSFALRRPAFADNLDIFEIDHPATQLFKIEQIKDCGVSLPSTVHFVPADLASEDLATILIRASFRKKEPAFFSWLGVTVYLTREANLATLRAVANAAAPEANSSSHMSIRTNSSRVDRGCSVTQMPKPWRRWGSLIDPGSIQARSRAICGMSALS